ncbi:MAG TPA: Gfo/Idh/MocA family oxidoreductase [Chthonomonadaceae bacterium]|nr:Gfo/Idh/MocA family oxidoreductase [Chthonomonadaceae bacterium]
MNQLRVGIVGMGIMGSSVGRVLARDARVQLVAATSLSLEKMAPICDELGIARRYLDYAEMFARESLDAVCVATPDQHHYAVVMAALNAGRHVLVEKPMTTDVNEAAEIVRRVRETGLKLQVSYNHRWLAPYNATWKMIREGKIGQPLMGYARKSNPILVPTEMLPWSGGSSPAWFLSGHDIDLMTWWFDADPVEAHGYGIKKVLAARGIDTYDMIQAQVKFSNGAFATFETCWIYPNSHPALPDSYMEVVGEAGQIVMDRKAEAIEMASAERFAWPRSLLNFQVFDKWVGAFPSCVESFIDAILEDRPPYVTAYDGWRATAALDAIHRSVASGQVEKIAAPPIAH